jgi:hypothetical protein
VSEVVAGRCPVCGEALGDLPLHRCASCETAVHAACAEFLGGCARYACVEAATTRGRVQRYLAERLMSEARTCGVIAAWCLPLSWVLPHQHVAALFLILGLYALGLAVHGARLRNAAPTPARLVRLLKQYPPIVTDVMRAGKWALFGKVLHVLYRGTAAGLALLTIAVGIFVALGAPLKEQVVGIAVLLAFAAGLAAFLLGALAAALAISDLITGAEDRPRWIGLADSWREEIEAFAAPPAARLTESEKPPPEK